MLKPILFNTQMVKAFLEDRKKATRRLVKLPKHIQLQDNGLYTLFAEDSAYEDQQLDQLYKSGYLKPTCAVGDILYVRETWKQYEKRVGEGAACHIEKFFAYKADEANPQNPSEFYNGNWHPSLHMTKAAARIFRLVTEIKLEKLQNITGADILSEGIAEPHTLPCRTVYAMGLELRESFETLWDSTIPKTDIEAKGWIANPWVWTISLEKCENPGL